MSAARQLLCSFSVRVTDLKTLLLALETLVSYPSFVPYSRKVSWGSIIADGRSFVGLIFTDVHMHSSPLCTVQSSFFVRGFNYRSYDHP